MRIKFNYKMNSKKEKNWHKIWNAEGNKLELWSLSCEWFNWEIEQWSMRFSLYKFVVVFSVVLFRRMCTQCCDTNVRQYLIWYLLCNIPLKRIYRYSLYSCSRAYFFLLPIISASTDTITLLSSHSHFYFLFRTETNCCLLWRKIMTIIIEHIWNAIRITRNKFC